MKLINYLGLCYKSKSLVCGSEKVLKAIRNKSLYLVIISQSASHNTLKTFTDKTSFYNVKLLTVPNEVIAKAFPHKTNIIFGITNSGLAHAILELKGADCCETKLKETKNE